MTNNENSENMRSYRSVDVNKDGCVESEVIETEDRIEYLNAKKFRHRIDGPAVVWKKECSPGQHIKTIPQREEWFQEDLRHRDDGPAVVFADGSFEYYKFGIRHRSDGPAVYRAETNEYEYWLHGQQYENKEFDHVINENALNSQRNSRRIKRILENDEKIEIEKSILPIAVSDFEIDFKIKISIWNKIKMYIGYFLYLGIKGLEKQYNKYLTYKLRQILSTSSEDMFGNEWTEIVSSLSSFSPEIEESKKKEKIIESAEKIEVD